MVNPYSAPVADLSVEHSADETYQPRIFAWSGRIGRLRYLGYGFLMTLLMYALITVVTIALSLGRAISQGMVAIIGPAIVATLLFCLVLLIPAKRRMNDLDHSGWLALLVLIPAVNLFVWLYLVFGRGTDGNNRYGPMPNKNPRGMILVALILPAIMTIGVLAAVALPAYQQYINKARAAKASQAQLTQQRNVAQAEAGATAQP